MITVNLEKAKTITHNLRREKRAKEFAPLDIKATIPSVASEAETQRQEIREKYASIQSAIDMASDVPELLAIFESLKT